MMRTHDRQRSDETVIGPARAIRGFSIVELMVAMAISLLLLAGIIAIFTSTKSSYETSDKLSRIQESGRYALDQFTYDIRSAGYVGCSRASTYMSSSLKVANPNLIWDFMAGSLQGFQYTSSSTWTPAFPAGVLPTDSRAPIDGSDILVLRIPVREAVPLALTAPMASASGTITVKNVAGAFKSGDIALAYSCEAQAFFQVTDYAGGVISHAATGSSPGNQVDTLSYSFRTNAEVVPVNTVVYYIAQSTAGNRASSLFRKVGGNDPEELVEGVEQMQIDYGVDTNADNVVDAYEAASATTNWDRVFTVRVALLVRSLEPYGGQYEQEYKLLTGGTAVTAKVKDRYYREVFTSTIGIRNKVVIN